MRKLIAFGALLALATALIGCGKKNVENRSDKESRSLEAARELIKSVEIAVQMYNMKHGGKYPDSLDALKDKSDSLLEGEPVDPWGNGLRYEKRGDKKRPIIRSAGPDGEFGTDDDLANQDVVKSRESIGRKVEGAVNAIFEKEGAKVKDAVESLDENTNKRLGE